MWAVCISHLLRKIDAWLFVAFNIHLKRAILKHGCNKHELYEYLKQKNNDKRQKKTA